MQSRSRSSAVQSPPSPRTAFPAFSLAWLPLLVLPLLPLGCGGPAGTAHPLPFRWVLLRKNLLLEPDLRAAERILARAKAAGYNGVVLSDAKLGYLDGLGPLHETYLAHLRQFKAQAEAFGLQVVPMATNPGTAGALLLHDPNLAEGLTVTRAPFTVNGARALPDPEPGFVNGSFQRMSEGRLEGFSLQEGLGTALFIDPRVRHGDHGSLRMEPAQTPILRVAQTLPVLPGHQYRLGVWVRTSGLALPGNAGVYVKDAQGRELAYADPALQPTGDWKRVQAAFVAPGTSVDVYFGVWGATPGTLWWADATLEAAGLLNAVRRASCPLSVTGEDGTVFEEGRDFAPFQDPALGVAPWPGSYSVDQPVPALRLLPGTRIRDGARLRVSGTVAKVFGEHGAAACIASPVTTALISAEMRNQARVLGATSFFLGHSEIPIANQDADCQGLGLDAGPLLARNVAALASGAPPGAQVFIWSDMLNPTQNARDGYDLVRGDLERSWAGLPPNLVIVNWDSANAARSLAFFEGLGLRQILAGYYDGDPASIKDWLAQARGIQGLAGVMYTTWKDDYSGLEAFAKAAF